MTLLRPLFAAVLAVIAFAPTGSAFAQSLPVRTTRTLARGITLIQEITPETSPDGPLVVNVVEVDPKAKGVRLEAALGQDRVWGSDPTFGREIVSTLTARRGAVVGMNACFFPFMGNPIGLHMQNGEMVTEPADKRTCFLLMKNGTAKIAAFDYSGAATLGDVSRAIDGLNRKPGKGDELLLFTPVFFDNTLRTPGRIEAVLSAIRDPVAPGKEYVGKVEKITEGGATPIAPGTVVLSGGGAGADFLRRAAPGTAIKFRLTTNIVRGDDFPLKEIREAVAGGPRLLTNGSVTITLKEERIGEAFSTTRHPRSAVGVTKDGKILLLTVDGRQKSLSRGASLTETAMLLLKFGAVDAVNMDGGGSTALIAFDTIINSPSEGKERPVASVLLIYGAHPKTKRDAETEALTLRVGEAQRILGAGKTVWGTIGGVGFVTQEGMFRALRPGKGVVYRIQDGKRAAFPVIVRGAATGDAPGFAAMLQWKEETLSDRATLQIRLANAEGDRLGSEMIRLQVTGGAAETETITTDAKGEATALIKWNVPAENRRSVLISSPNHRFVTAQIEYAPK